ncbi:peptidase M24 [Sulfolobus acidocaldarius SUSAZ]|nr:peptidase M24 [Sulfolobus acidocaldarius SUSAZ]
MRLQKLDRILEERDVKNAIIIGGANIFYLTGYDYISTDFANTVALIYNDSVPILVVPVLEKNRAQSKVGDKIEIVAYSSYQVSDDVIRGSLVDVISRYIETDRRIAIDMLYSGSMFYLSLSKKISSENLVDVSKDFYIIRAKKEPEELELIKKAGDITSSAMKISSEKIHEESVSEKQLAGLIDMTMRNEGAEEYAFSSIVAFAENSAFPHHIPTDRTIKNGENAVIDIGARYNNYCFDSTRTFVKSNNDEVKKVYEIVLQAQEEAIDAVRDGTRASEIDRIARNVIEKAGYGKYFVHSTGHGVGIEIHEYPSISLSSDAILEENMVITVEPGIYLKGKFGIRIEDTIILTKKKPIVLETIYKYL